jgi:PAS domain S-box-containing protein
MISLSAFIALSYAVVGKLSLLLAVPPGFTSPIFLPAGIAISAALLLGYRVWPAILAGSLILNISFAFDSASELSLTRIMSMLAISLGAVLQALTGTWLIRRFVGDRFELLERNTILIFLTIAAPASCMISAAIKVASLLGTGLIPRVEIATNFTAWWLEDTMGVLVVLPLALIAWGQPRDLWRSRRWTVGIPTVAGFLISLGLFAVTSDWEIERTRHEFEDGARDASVEIEKAFATKVESLYAIRDAVSLIPAMTSADFQNITKGLLERDSSIHFIRWLPRVTHANRANFEQTAQLGFPKYQFWNPDKNGMPQTRNRQLEYFPIQFVSPLSNYEVILGLDAASFPAQQSAIQKAIREGRAIATLPIKLHTSDRHSITAMSERNVFVYAPVLHQNKSVRGVVAISIRGDEVAPSAIVGGISKRFGRFEIIDDSLDQRKQVAIFQFGAKRLLESGYKKLNEMFTTQTHFEFASRKYSITAEPTTEFIHNSRSLLSWEMFLIGLMLTSLISISQLVTTGASAKLIAVNEERSKALRQMRAAETRLRLSQQAARVGSFEWDAESNTISCSPEMETIYGLKHRLFAKTLTEWEDLIHPEDKGKFRYLNQSTLQMGHPIEAEWRTIWPDGSVHWISSRYQGFSDLITGKPVRLAGVNIDITERKQIQDELMNNEVRFRALVDASAQIVWTTGVDGRALEDSPSWRAFTGQTYNEYKDFGFFDAIHPDDKKLVIQDWTHSLATRSPLKAEYRIRHASGEWHWTIVRAVPLLNADRTIRGWVGMNTDISERKQSEVALMDSEARFRAIFEQAAMGVALIDSQAGTILRVNQRYAKLMGCSVNEMIGKTYQHLIHPSDIPTTVSNMERLRSREISEFTMEQRRFRKNGSTLWVSLTISQTWTGDRSSSHHIAIIEDITEKIQARDVLHKSNELLEQRVESRTAELKQVVSDLARTNSDLEQFAYIASHDLQEPLRRITSYVGLFLEKYLPIVDANGVRYLNYISDGARRMSILIDDMLAYSLIGRGDEVAEQIDLNDVIDEVLKIQISSIEQTATQFEIDELPKLPIPKTEAYQLFSNLVSNGIKFRRPNTSPTIRIRALRKDSFWDFSVADNGIGIDSEYLDDIFVIFKRLHSRASYAGTGIGLSICKKIVERHNGIIWAESAQGMGTTIHFTIPDPVQADRFGNQRNDIDDEAENQIRTTEANHRDTHFYAT